MGDNNEAFMEDFGDSLLNDEGDPYEMKSSRNAAEALDTSLQAPNANDFSNARLIEEVSVRANLRLLCEAQVCTAKHTDGTTAVVYIDIQLGVSDTRRSCRLLWWLPKLVALCVMFCFLAL